MQKDIAKAFVAGLVGFALGCAIIHATSGQSFAVTSHSIGMAQYTAPRTPTFLQYQVAAETRPSLRGSPEELLVAPSLSFVKDPLKIEQQTGATIGIPIKKGIDEDKKQGISTKNYNSVPAANTQKWGIGATSNGRRAENIYAGATIPEVGERPAPGELIMGLGLKPDEFKTRGYGGTKEYAMFGNSEYEKLSNNLKPKVTDNVDQSPKARR